ncbi:MAG: hypothetical protein ACKOZW_03675, partial [Cyanobium sp.]
MEWSASTRQSLQSEGAHAYPSLESISEGELFDAVILKDVLEHVPDFAWWRQQAMVRDLQLGARVVPKDLNPWEHLSRFSPRSLHAALASTGWRRLPQATVDYSFRGVERAWREAGEMLPGVEILGHHARAELEITHHGLLAPPGEIGHV